MNNFIIFILTFLYIENVISSQIVVKILLNRITIDMLIFFSIIPNDIIKEMLM